MQKNALYTTWAYILGEGDGESNIFVRIWGWGFNMGFYSI